MHGRKNFYGIWAMLRRALTLPSGECPYLIRQQQGLRLDASLLTSDVAQLEDVCRTLLFERPGYGGWAQVYSQVNDRFSDDLLPSENGNDALASLRVDYRNRLVDALVAASTRLVAAGEAQEMCIRDSDELRAAIGAVPLEELFMMTFNHILLTLVERRRRLHPATVEVWNHYVARSRDAKAEKGTA